MKSTESSKKVESLSLLPSNYMLPKSQSCFTRTSCMEVSDVLSLIFARHTGQKMRRQPAEVLRANDDVCILDEV